MDDCIFCKILSNEMGTDFLYEDEKCAIFRDMYPKAKTHLLVVPKKHIHSIAEMDEGDEKIVGHLALCAKNLATKLGLSGYNLQINVGKDGGQEIFHLHIHLMSKF